MDIKEFLARTIFFNGLSDRQIEMVCRIVRPLSFKKGDNIFRDGDIAKGFYILHSGRVKIFKISFEGKEQILHIIRPGEPFGEVALFTGTIFPANAEAMEDSEILFVQREPFIKLLSEDPSISLGIIAVLSKRLKEFASLVEDLSLKEVPQRLATYLLGQMEPGSPDILYLGIGKGQLASILGTIPETLSRVLKKMADSGIIEVSGRRIKIKDRERLTMLSSGETTVL